MSISHCNLWLIYLHCTTLNNMFENATVFGTRGGYSGICNIDGCGGYFTHSLHFLGCTKRPWFQLSWAFLVWCCNGPAGFCFYSGTWICLQCIFSETCVDHNIALLCISHCCCLLSGGRFYFHWVGFLWWSMAVWRQSFSVGTSYMTQTTW